MKQGALHATVRERLDISRPLERSAAPDGGPLAYRVAHKVNRWRPGEAPQLQQRVIEGEPPLATQVSMSRSSRDRGARSPVAAV